jgi:hypothetical protein
MNMNWRMVIALNIEPISIIFKNLNHIQKYINTTKITNLKLLSDFRGNLVMAFYDSIFSK